MNSMNGPKTSMTRQVQWQTNYLLILVIKALENIPMKVATKTMAFTDPTPTAMSITEENLKLRLKRTEESLIRKMKGLITPIIAFRATGNKNGHGGNASYNHYRGI